MTRLSGDEVMGSLLDLGLPELRGDLVRIIVDGNAWIAAFRVDDEEHQRRARLGLGAVTDRRVLHALWSLPEDLVIHECALSPVDLATLIEHHAGVVEQRERGLRRLFRPAGSVVCAISVARTARDAIRRLSLLPPIFSRVAVAREGVTSSSTDLARRRKVGLIESSVDSWKVRVAPPKPALGSPAVYRWWVSELAYASWRYAHCAH